MILFFIFLLTILVSSFSLGGIMGLYLKYKTLILQRIILFLLSLLGITISIWFKLPFFQTISEYQNDLLLTSSLIHMAGSILNILVIPYLVSSLTAKPIIPNGLKLLWLWTFIYTVLRLTIIFIPAIQFINTILLLMQTGTIAGGVASLFRGMKQSGNNWWKKAIRLFFSISTLFLFFLILDILITVLPIRQLAFWDNFSLPFYLIVLNAGILYFSYQYLNREALLNEGKLTESCIDFYQLTPRETELTECIVAGSSNKEIAGKLNISLKTVENHISNIFKKMDVGSRIQLVNTLYQWEKN